MPMKTPICGDPSSDSSFRQVNILAAAWVINTLAYSIVYPFLPIYLHTIRGLPMPLVGLVYPLMGIARVTAPFVSGPLIDRLGRRIILISGPATRSVVFFALAGAARFNAPFWVFALLLFANAFFGQFFQNASDAYVIDITLPHQRPEAFSRVRVGLNIGWMSGPAIGAFLARTPFSLLFALTGLLCIGTVIVTARFCPESTRHSASFPTQRERFMRLPRQLVIHFSLAFALFLVSSQLISTLSIYASSLEGVSRNNVGFLYTINGLLVILFQIPLNRGLGPHHLYSRMAIGALFYAAGYFSLGFSSLWLHLVFSVMIITSGEMLFEPASSAIVSHLCTPDRIGRVMGVYGMVKGVGFSIGPFIGAMLYTQYSMRPVLLWGILSMSGLIAATGFLIQRSTRAAGV